MPHYLVHWRHRNRRCVIAELNNSGTGQWSELDNGNTSPSPDGWPNGTYPNQVEPISRSVMAAIKRFWDRVNGTIVASGSANAYIYTPVNTAYPTAYVTGEIYTFAASFTNTGPATLNVNGLGAVPITKSTTTSLETPLVGGEIQSGQYVTVCYYPSASPGAFQLMSISANASSQLPSNVGIGSAPLAAAGLYLRSSGLTGATQYAVFSQPIFGNSTGNSIGILSTGTIPNGTSGIIYQGFYASNPTVVSGGNVATAYGLFIEGITVGTTANWGVYSVSSPNYFGGNVLVGTTTALGKLTVASDGSLTFPIAVNNLAAGSGNQNAVSFSRNGTVTGSITNTSTSTFYNTTSDKRLKTNVRPITKVGGIIDSIEPVSYDWSHVKEFQREYGFLAQDLHKIFPAAVTVGDSKPRTKYGDVDFKSWSVDPGKLIPLMVAEIKDLRKRLALVESNNANTTNRFNPSKEN